MSQKSQLLFKRFSGLVYAVRKDHETKHALRSTGHDFSHAWAVGELCLKIADDPIATWAWLAAMCHNTDRHYGEGAVVPMVMSYLSLTNLSDREKIIILEAVLNHSKRNSPDDNPVTVVLKDADKLDNAGHLGIGRSVQHHPDHTLIDLRYLNERPPGTSFKKPGNIYWDITGHIEWFDEGYYRTPKAIESAEKKARITSNFREGMKEEAKESGFQDYPWPEDFDAVI